MSYQRGDAARVAILVVAEGVAVEPQTLTLTFRAPSGTTTTWANPSVEIVRDDTGAYHAEIALTEAGAWTYEWQATAPQRNDGATIWVDPSPLDAPVAAATVGELRSYLRSGEQGGMVVPGSRENDDVFLARLLLAATRRAERYTHREFLPTPAGPADPAVTRTFTGQGGRLFSVSDIREIDALVADGVLVDPAGYALVGAPGEPANLLHLTIAALQIVVTGRYGFAAVPDDVKLAVLAMAARGFHDAQARLADRVVDPDGGVSSYFRQLPVEAKGVLDSYLRPAPIPVAS